MAEVIAGWILAGKSAIILYEKGIERNDSEVNHFQSNFDIEHILELKKIE